jgi:uncharacterized coiled-coil DUF342 family protein
MTPLKTKFKQMYSSEIVPLLEQKKKLNAKRDELYAKRNELDAKRDELYAKINELYAKINELDAKRYELYIKRNELDAKRNELNAKIFLKFDKFEKENDCKVEWNNDYDFKLKNLEVKEKK